MQVNYYHRYWDLLQSGMLRSLQQNHLSGIVGFATKNELRRSLIQSLDEKELVKMGDYRFRGYVNDFMYSPRNPITTTVKRQPAKMDPSNQVRNLSYAQQDPEQDSTPIIASQSADLRERKAEADREIASFKHEKLLQMLQAEEARRQELAQLQSIQPYGKPGGGAPNNDNMHQGQKFPEYDANPVDQESIPFQQDGGVAEPAPHHLKRYYKTQQPVGDSTSVGRAMADTQSRINQLQQEINAMNSIPYIDPVGGNFHRPTIKEKPFQFYDPWGKGQGNPRRLPNGNTERYPRTKEHGILADSKPVARSWPNSTTSPIKMEELTAQQLSTTFYDNEEYQGRHETGAGTGLITESKFGGGGSVVKTDSGNARTRYPITMKRDPYGNSSLTELDGYNPFKVRAPDNSNYFPFGKPGAGAPLRNQEGKPNVARRNIDFAHELDTSADIQRRRRAADEYLHELKKEMSEQRRNREEAIVDHKAPIGELASVVRQGKVGQPKRDPETGNIVGGRIKYSDITKDKAKMPDTKRKFAGVVGGDDSQESVQNARKYHDDLSRIAEERHRLRQLERMREYQEEQKHGEKWNEFWGKPGAGAPLSTDPNASFRRPKFEEVLHHNANANSDSLIYMKNTPVGIKQLQPSQYLRSTIDSNHNNMFELPTDKSKYKAVKGEYKFVAPFATL